MPCDCSHMEPFPEEIRAAKLVRLLDEVRGDGVPDPNTFADGMDERTYSKGIKADAMDMMAAEICKFMQSANPQTCSLELQMWWRDHQQADKERLERELDDNKTTQAREAALKKLTPWERRLLGV